MSGHSKWHNIQMKKGKVDAARGKIFTKLGREILIAVKQGGADIASNAKLKDVVAKAKANNMPNDTINNAIKKAAGAGNNENYEEIIYEGYGPNGTAIIIIASTDNKNRTVADIRHVFSKHGGNLGTNGCVAYLFTRKGLIVITKEDCKMTEDDLMMLVLESGAEDFVVDDDCYEITTSPETFTEVREKLEQSGLTFVQADISMIPSTYITLDEKAAEKMQKLLDGLDDNDDVLEVYHNWEG